MTTIERLLQQFNVGDRVVASFDIVYASVGMTIAEGSRATVERVRVAGCDPLVAVRWAGQSRAIATSVDCLDPEGD